MEETKLRLWGRQILEVSVNNVAAFFGSWRAESTNSHVHVVF